MLSNKYYTHQEVIEMAGVSRNTVFRDVQTGKLKCVYVGKLKRFSEEEVLKYVQSKKDSKWVQLWKDKNENLQSTN